MEARPANLGDVPAVGGLVQASLSSARSSMFGSNDLAEDPLEVGREILGAALAAGELAWVLETGEQIAGVAIATRRALARARHVGDLRLLVHPLARGRGGGRMLLDKLVADAHRSAALHKLAIHVAVDDEALQRTIDGSHAPWVRERVEHGALRRGALILDMDVWGLVLGHGPTP